MQVCFTSNSDGARWAWTEGLREVALRSEQEAPQAELGTPLPWLPDELRDGQVERLLTFLHRYLIRHGNPIRAGQTIRYGWTTLRTRPMPESGGEGHEQLVLQEMADPFTAPAAESDAAFADGVSLATALLGVQEEALRRNQITGTADHPHRSDTAVVCSRVAREGGTPLTLARLALTERHVHDSGWFVGCQDRDHQHDDPEELRGVHLRHVVAAYPWVFPYLGLPAGSSLTHSEAGIVLFRPGERRGQVDDAPPFGLPVRPR